MSQRRSYDDDIGTAGKGPRFQGGYVSGRHNQADLEAARGTVSEVMLDRLALSPERIAGMAQGIREVAALPDPVGAVLQRVERPSGIVVEKTAVPMGVIAIIYESRPNVTSDAAALALKAGSACVLRGGKEALPTPSNWWRTPPAPLPTS